LKDILAGAVKSGKLDFEKLDPNVIEKFTDSTGILNY